MYTNEVNIRLVVLSNRVNKNLTKWHIYLLVEEKIDVKTCLEQKSFS